MSRNEREENVGEIAVRSDESFWIFPKRYILIPRTDIYSPWFSFFGEMWQFIISPSHCDDVDSDFYLWRKFRRDLPSSEYILQLKLKTLDGELVAFSEKSSKCDYGFQVSDFCSKDDLKNPEITGCEQIKIFFLIKQKYHSEVDQSCATDTVRRTDDISENNGEPENAEVPEYKGVDRLVKNLENLLLNEWGSDVVLKSSDHEFRAHRTILGARSPVFEAMFQHDMTEKKTGEVDISDCSTAGFKVFLQFLYSGNADISSSIVLDLYYIADKYQVGDLKLDCVEVLKDTLTVDNFCDVIALSLRHNESDLRESATQFFCSNIRAIVTTVNWQKYLAKNPTHANELIIRAVHG